MLTLALLLANATVAPCAEDWREALAARASTLQSISYRFQAAGGTSLVFALKEGSYAARWPAGGPARAPSECLETRHVDPGGVEWFERHATVDGQHRSWFALAADSRGQGRILFERAETLRDIYLPKQFQEALSEVPMSVVLATWTLEDLGDTQLEGHACRSVLARAPGSGSGLFHLWLDPRHGFVPRGIDLLLPIGEQPAYVKRMRGRLVDPVEIGGGTYFPVIEWRARAIGEPHPGVFLVTKGDVGSPVNASGERFQFEIDPASVRINEPEPRAAEVFRFPDGCKVSDEVRSRSYVEGRAGQECVAESELVAALLKAEPRARGRAAEVAGSARSSVIESACGANVLFTLYASRGQYVPLDAIHAQAYVQHPSPGSLLALADCARAAGDDPRILKVPLDDLDRLATPLVVHLEDTTAGHSEGHYVLLWAVEADRVLGADPPRAAGWIPRASLERAWTGYVLTLAPDPAGWLSGTTRTSLVAGAAVLLMLATGIGLARRRARPSRGAHPGVPGGAPAAPVTPQLHSP